VVSAIACAYRIGLLNEPSHGERDYSRLPEEVAVHTSGGSKDKLADQGILDSGIISRRPPFPAPVHFATPGESQFEQALPDKIRAEFSFPSGETTYILKCNEHSLSDRVWLAAASP